MNKIINVIIRVIINVNVVNIIVKYNINVHVIKMFLNV